MPSIGAVRTGCLCCPPKPETAPMDWQPHPGFGGLYLTRDGETPAWWEEFASISHQVYYHGRWEKHTHRDGTEYEHFSGGEYIDWLHERVTLGEIEECVTEDPDHDWRLEIHGPLGGVVYQRQGCAQWVAVERLGGFA